MHGQPSFIYFVLLLVFLPFAHANLPDQAVRQNKDYGFSGDGRRHAQPLPSLYTANKPVDIYLTTIEPSLQSALDNNIAYLNTRLAYKTRHHRLGSLRVSEQDLLTTAHDLRESFGNPDNNLINAFDFYQIQGDDLQGNVLFTGYFSPVLKVRAQAGERFRFPLYAKPRQWPGGKPLSRRQIDSEKLLAGLGLELAWTDDPLSNFFLQVQGSGFIEYPDGERNTLQYGGNNKHAYKSIGRYLIDSGDIAAKDMSLEAIKRWMADNPHRRDDVLNVNPSYTFFDKSSELPKGASNVAVTPLYSVAVDPKYIPLGSILMAEVPILDSQGKLLSHQYRMLFAQDKGSAIKGAGHIDWYRGVGNDAGAAAGQLNHYGKVWLLLAKSRDGAR